MIMGALFLTLGPSSFGSQNCVVVDFGDDLVWQCGVQGIPTYRGKSVTTLFKGSNSGPCPVDVDEDGSTEDDSMAYYPFSMDETYNQVGSCYNIKGNNTRFYGGAVSFFANKKPQWAEGGINVDHALRDDLNLHSYATEGGDKGVRTFGVWLWKKADFRNGGDQYPVSFDAGSLIGVYVSRDWNDYEEGRFIVQDGGKFYISEFTFGKKTQTLFSVAPDQTRWAEYALAGPYQIEFKSAGATFEKMEFKDVQACGWYIAKPTLGRASLWIKWHGFAIKAVVNRPEAPSYLLKMKPMAEGAGSITEAPLSYADWRAIYTWGNRNQVSLFPAYCYDRDGNMGSMLTDEGAHSSAESVTDITWLDALAWCNALSEYEGLEPCFYTDAENKSVLRSVLNRKDADQRDWRPEVFVKWTATGFRPATEKERPTGSTGLFVVRNSKAPADAAEAMGAWKKFFQPVPIPSEPGKPDIKMIALPAGSFQRPDGSVVKINPLSMSETEVTYSQWKKAFAWGANHGYQLDRDGDLGSMDWSNPGASFSQDHPVTQISPTDMMAWCNALSEMEGKTPVYYSDKEMTNVYKVGRRFRHENAEPGVHMHILKDNGTTPIYSRWDVDGYRLPTQWEWEYAYRAGTKGQKVYPWGNEAISEYAWIGDNSGDQTHPVGKKKANSLGFHDMAGNAFEVTLGDGASYYTTDNPRGKGYPIVMGASFRTVGEEIPMFLRLGWETRWMPISAEVPKAYPEIGFRVVRCDKGVHPKDEPPVVPENIITFDTKALDKKSAAGSDGADLQDAIWRGNLARTGEFSSPGPLKEPKVKWIFSTGKPIKSSPIITGGVVYVGSDDGHLYAIDLASGKEKWKYAVGAPVRCSATVAGGRVFLTSANGVHAVDAASGAKLWIKSGSFWDDSPLVLNLPIQHRDGKKLDGLVFYAEPWKGLVGLDVATGNEMWRYRDGRGPGKDGCSAFIHRGMLGFFRGSQATVLVNALTERMVYEIDGGIDNGIFTPAGRDGICYSYIGGIVAFDIEENGKLGRTDSGKYKMKWRYFPQEDKSWDRRHPGISSISVDDKAVYFGQVDKNVYALNRETGELLWKRPTGGPVSSSPALGTGDLLFVGSQDKMLYGISKLDGSVRWTFATGGPVTSSPAPVGNLVVVGSDDGNIYALE